MGWSLGPGTLGRCREVSCWLSINENWGLVDRRHELGSLRRSLRGGAFGTWDTQVFLIPGLPSSPVDLARSHEIQLSLGRVVEAAVSQVWVHHSLSLS